MENTSRKASVGRASSILTSSMFIFVTMPRNMRQSQLKVKINCVENDNLGDTVHVGIDKISQIATVSLHQQPEQV